MPWHWKDGKPVAWVDAAPAPAEVEHEKQPPAPPMREPGWVEMFLNPNESGLPLRMPPRSPSVRRRGAAGAGHRRHGPRRRG